MLRFMPVWKVEINHDNFIRFSHNIIPIFFSIQKYDIALISSGIEIFILVILALTRNTGTGKRAE